MALEFVTNNGVYYSFEVFSFIPTRISGTGIAPVYNEMVDLSPDDGGEYRKTRALERIITITGTFAAGDFVQEQDDIRTLTSLLFQREITLSSGDRERTILVRYAGGLEGDTASMDSGEQVVLRFLAVQPFWLSAVPDAAEITHQLEVGTMEIINQGDTDAFPTITLRGGGSIASIENETTGAILEFDGLTLKAGETIIISLSPQSPTIKSDSRPDVVSYLSPLSTFHSFVLSPGDNTIVFTGALQERKMSWYRRYWGAL